MSLTVGNGFLLPEKKPEKKVMEPQELPWGVNFQPSSSSSGYRLPTNAPMSSSSAQPMSSSSSGYDPGVLPPEKSSSTATGEVVEQPKVEPVKEIKKTAKQVAKASAPKDVHDKVVEQRDDTKDTVKVEDTIKATTPDAPVDNLDKHDETPDPEPYLLKQVKNDPKIGRWTAYHQNKMKLLGTNIPIPGFDMPGSRAHKALIEDVNAERQYNQMQIDKLRYNQQKQEGDDSRVKAKKIGEARSSYERTIKEYSDGLYRKDGTNGMKTLMDNLAKIKNSALESGLVNPIEADYMFRDPPPYIIAKGQNSAAYLKLSDDKQFLNNLQDSVDSIYKAGEVTPADQAQLDSSINHLIGVLGGDAANTADAERVRRQYLMLKPEKAEIVRNVIRNYFKAQKDVADAAGQSQWSVSFNNKLGEIQRQFSKLDSGDPLSAVGAIGSLVALGLSTTTGLPMDAGTLAANNNENMLRQFMDNVMMSADVDFEQVEKLVERAYGKTVGSMNARNEAIGSGYREVNNYERRNRAGKTIKGPGKSLVDEVPDFATGRWVKIANPQGPDLSADNPDSRNQKEYRIKGTSKGGK